MIPPLSPSQLKVLYTKGPPLTDLHIHLLRHGIWLGDSGAVNKALTFLWPANVPYLQLSYRGADIFPGWNHPIYKGVTFTALMEASTRMHETVAWLRLLESEGVNRGAVALAAEHPEIVFNEVMQPLLAAFDFDPREYFK